MTPTVVRPVSVSAQAGRQACSEDAAAGRGPGTGMLCVLFKQWLVSVQAWRSGGKEVAACLHSWIVRWAPPVSNALLFKHSQVWRWPPLMPVFTALPSHHLSLSGSVCEQWRLIATTFFPTVDVCCFNLEAWMINEKYYKALFITLRHEGRATIRDVQTDEEMEGGSLI